MLKGNVFSADFPALNVEVEGRKLVYLDSAATTQKPLKVLRAVEEYYSLHNANPHRGAYHLSVKATEAYENARDKVRDFLGARSSKEIIFTKNATEAFNLLAYSYGMSTVGEGDGIVISIAEHHSNLVPWQTTAKSKGAVLKYMYINEEGIIPPEEIQSKITSSTKIVAVTQASNALGTINPIRDIVKRAREVGAVVIVDGSQSVPHMEVDVVELDVDFLVFSGHKLLAPMGIGVLYGKEELLTKMPPFLFGGDMIEYVTEQETTFAEVPNKFEGGTQNVGGAVGLSAAIDYLKDVGLDNIRRIEEELLQYTLDQLKEIPYVTIYGTTDISKKSGAISFNIKGVHPHDVSSILDSYGVAIRAGHHCAQPLMKYLGLNSTCRVSFYFYNTKDDIDRFIDGIKNVRKWLGYGS
jgi:cysteine desulfurase / selenocysteine lyase